MDTHHTANAFVPNKPSCAALRFHRPSLPTTTTTTTTTTATSITTSITSQHSPSLPTSTSLPMMSSSVGGSLLVLSFVVTIHELGHYMAARSFGMNVTEFSVGIGPKIFGFTALGNDFSLRAFPLGGYVRFPENYNVTLLEQRQEEEMEKRLNQFVMDDDDDDYDDDDDDDVGRDLNGNSKFVAGLLNILTLGQYGKGIAEKLVQQQLEKEQEQEKKPWFTNVFKTNKNEPKSSSVDVDEPFQIEYYTDPNLLQNRPWQQRAVVVAGGVVFNILLAFSIYFGQISTTGLNQQTFGNGVVVASTPSAGASSAGILKQGDLIFKVNGQSLTTQPNTINAAMAQKGISDFIATIRATEDNKPLSLAVKRNNDVLNVIIQPTKMTENGPKSIGVLLKPNFLKSELIQTSNVKDAAVLAAQSVQEITSATAQGVSGLLGTLLRGKGVPAGQGVSGPVGLIRTGSQVVSSNDLATILTFSAAISVNLAVVNSLPLPALDGGQMVFILYEAITGRKVDQKFQESLTSVTALLLFLLTVTTTFSDVRTILR